MRVVPNRQKDKLIWWIDPYHDHWGLITYSKYDGDNTYNHWYAVAYGGGAIVDIPVHKIEVD